VVKIDNLSFEIAKQLRQFTSFVEEEVEISKEEVTKEAIKALRENSPKQTGSYSKGWRLKKTGRALIIHNATDYQLTHLLEYGHVKVGGGRTPGVAHIRPAEEQAIKDYVDRVERAIKS
jgi:hypothetical protein